ASRSAKAGDETVPDRVATDGKDDGNCRGRSPGRNRCGKVVGKDGGHLIANQLGSEVGKAIILVRIPQFDDYIASFDITQVVQALAERCQAIRHRWLSRVQPSDNRDRCLLRARRERPRDRRAAEERHERAAFHTASHLPRRLGAPSQRRPAGNRRVFYAGTYTHRSMTKRTRIEYTTTHTMSEAQPRLSSIACSLMEVLLGAQFSLPPNGWTGPWGKPEMF